MCAATSLHQTLPTARPWAFWSSCCKLDKTSRCCSDFFSMSFSSVSYLWLQKDKKRFFTQTWISNIQSHSCTLITLLLILLLDRILVFLGNNTVTFNISNHTNKYRTTLNNYMLLSFSVILHNLSLSQNTKWPLNLSLYSLSICTSQNLINTTDPFYFRFLNPPLLLCNLSECKGWQRSSSWLPSAYWGAQASRAAARSVRWQSGTARPPAETSAVRCRRGTNGKWTRFLLSPRTQSAVYRLFVGRSCLRLSASHVETQSCKMQELTWNRVLKTMKCPLQPLSVVFMLYVFFMVLPCRWTLLWLPSLFWPTCQQSADVIRFQWCAVRRNVSGVGNPSQPKGNVYTDGHICETINYILLAASVRWA